MSKVKLKPESKSKSPQTTGPTEPPDGPSDDEDRAIGLADLALAQDKSAELFGVVTPASIEFLYEHYASYEAEAHEAELENIKQALQIAKSLAPGAAPDALIEILEMVFALLVEAESEEEAEESAGRLAFAGKTATDLFGAVTADGLAVVMSALYPEE